MPRKKRVVTNNITDEGKEVSSKKIPGRPSPEVIESQKEVLEKKTREYFFITPSGVTCKKIVEITRTPRGRYERVIKIEKNVDMR